jgi:hypothetical protein
MKKPTVKTYTIRNCNGLQGSAWAQTYTSRGDAKRAMKLAMGWTRLYLSPSYTTSETSESVSAYGSLSEMRRDDDGRANAPTIVTHFAR